MTYLNQHAGVARIYRPYRAPYAQLADADGTYRRRSDGVLITLARQTR